MPRKWLETVQDWPPLAPGQGHDVRIGDVEKMTDGPGMRVQLEFLAGEQAGRRLSVVLPLPCRPGGVIHTLLVATGLDVSVGIRFAPRDLVGKEVVAFFSPVPDGGVAVARFEACAGGAGRES